MKRIGAVLAVVAVGLTALAATAAADTITVTQLSPHGWDVQSQTRSAGHVEMRSGRDAGMRIFTDNATSEAKVAGYVAVTPIAMSVVAAGPEPSMVYLPTEGPAPGYQLVMAGKDTTGVARTWILVGETVYGDKWWAASCGAYCANLGIPASTGGGGPYQGTLDEWAAALPAASVTKVGFSLGSGVQGDGILKSLTFRSTTWQFVYERPKATTRPPAPAVLDAPADGPAAAAPKVKAAPPATVAEQKAKAPAAGEAGAGGQRATESAADSVAADGDSRVPSALLVVGLLTVGAILLSVLRRKIRKP